MRIGNFRNSMIYHGAVTRKFIIRSFIICSWYINEVVYIKFRFRASNL